MRLNLDWRKFDVIKPSPQQLNFVGCVAPTMKPRVERTFLIDTNRKNKNAINQPVSMEMP